MRFFNENMVTPQLREDAKTWADALRSGKYAQGKDYLRSGNQFCCLGVLCDLHNPHMWEKSLTGRDRFYYQGSCTMPPDTVLGGLISGKICSDSSPEEDDDLCAGQVLAELNDTGASFVEIAFEIERLFGLR